MTGSEKMQHCAYSYASYSPNGENQATLRVACAYSVREETDPVCIVQSSDVCAVCQRFMASDTNAPDLAFTRDPEAVKCFLGTFIVGIQEKIIEERHQASQINAKLTDLHRALLTTLNINDAEARRSCLLHALDIADSLRETFGALAKEELEARQ